VARWRAATAEEAPWQYKEPQAVVRSLAQGGVARLEPICIVKG
jgi:RNA-splicing ligase RtcB